MQYSQGFLIFLWITSTTSLSNYSEIVSSLSDDDTLLPEHIDLFRNEHTTDLEMPDLHSGLDNPSHLLRKIRIGSREGMDCPQSCFCELEEKYASCVGDGQWSLPILPSSLKRVELRGFQIPELHTSSVRFPELLELKLQQCNLTILHPEFLLSAPRLDNLDLSQNLITTLTKNIFRGLTSLKHLDLSSNILTNLSHPFTHLQSLEHLNLRNNNLTDLGADTFVGLSKVQYVNLDSNFIETIDIAAFQHLSSLAHLILSNNPLSKLSRLNFFGSRLQFIDVSNIGIKNVPQALTQFVKDLRLAKNKIEEIHRGDLDSYPYLGLLVLDDNGLQSLEEDALGRHEYLVRLLLNNNKLKAIPQSLPMSLKAIYLEGNQITMLNDSDFSGLSHLEMIFLKRNQINHLSQNAFKDLIALKTLDLQENNITILSQAIFVHLIKLESLDLSGNPITSLNTFSFDGLRHLTILKLSRIRTQQITIPDQTLQPLGSLQVFELFESPKLVEALMNSSRLLHSLRGIEELNLMRNRLQTLRKDFFSFFPKLTSIKLGNNAWNCSSKENVMYINHWMTNTPINFFRSFTVRCDSPVYLHLKPIILLNDSDFLSDLTTTMAPLETKNFTDVESPIFVTKEVDSSISEKNESFPEVDSITLSNLSNITQSSMITFIEMLTDTKDLETQYNNLTTLNPIKTRSEVSKKNITFKSAYADQEDDEDEDEFLYSAEDDIDGDEDYDILESSTVMLPIQTRNNSKQLQLSSTETPTTFSSIISPTTSMSAINTQPTKKIGRYRALLTSLRNSKIKILTTTISPFWQIYNREIKSSIVILNNSETSVESSSMPPTIPVSEYTNFESLKLVITERADDKFLKNSSLPPVTNFLRTKEFWLYRGEDHSNNANAAELSIQDGQARDHSLIIGAGILTSCLGVSLIIAAYILVRTFNKKHRRTNSWENGCTSYWQRRDSGDHEDCLSIDLVVGSDDSEGSMGLITDDAHQGLSNRLYLLLQRDSFTGITPETLPDPNHSNYPNFQSSQATQLNSLSSRIM